VYEPLNEDACAGLAAAIALFGGRSLWLSYESFAINGWPIVQTVSQAMAELRRKTPSQVNMFTAGALEQGRNGWTHQRPEIESYCAAMMRNGNHFPLFPGDANIIQAAYEWALGTHNKSIAIFASKTALPVRTTLTQARQAIEVGAVTLYETTGDCGPLAVLAVAGDMVLLPAFSARDALEQAGIRVRIVSIANPRRLYRPGDLGWNTVSEPDGRFMDDETFAGLFDGAASLIDEQLSYTIARYVFGRSAEFRRRAADDRQMQVALELLAKASTPQALISLGAAAPPATR